jgi:hypothetical protein
MRTTVALDDDVAAILKGMARTRNVRVRNLVNEALRRGPANTAATSPPREPFRTTEVSLGHCRVGLIDNTSEVLAR